MYPSQPQAVPMPDSAPDNNSLVSKVELNFECQNLIKMDIMSKSDPLIVCYVGTPRNTSPNHAGFQWREYGRTEKIMNNSNPVFNKTISMDFHFEEVQPLRFLVVDIDNATTTIEDDDKIGYVDIQLAEIAGSKGHRITKALLPTRAGESKNRGSITITMHELGQNSRDTLSLKFHGQKLAKRDWGLLGGSSDPYFIVKRFEPATNTFISLYKSETIMKNLNPQWKPFQIPMFKIIPESLMRQAAATGTSVDLAQVKLRLEVWDYDRLSSDDEIGTAECSLADLMARNVLTLIDPKKKNAGTIHTDYVEVIKRFSFLDYLRCGTEISLMCAIDWTGSNGIPSDPRSLHYFDPSGRVMNEYEQAIRAVTNIVGYYDRDQLFPLFGFGGRFANGTVSHCFNLNMNPSNPDVQGLDGILYAYKQAFSQVSLHGPTYFNAVVQNASAIAQESASGREQKYYVLLVITDGAINDMQMTLDAIVQATELPLSIIIVGVGNADFTDMNTLDGDDGLLKSSSGKVAARDIVQFVPFSKFKALPYQELARETLAELPLQVEEYFAKKGIKPIGMQ